MPPKGRPRKEIADDATQKKRDYQRNYQTARKNKLSELTEEIKKCQDDLKKMKDQRKQLQAQAREDLRAFREKRQVMKGNRIPAPSVIPV